ncbi:hypothetical protein FA13DRAFT_1756136 [Coprinellus micaceus]|uniref:Zn(2)-C6 fungal-type domain-containing protein n=1 Tax=Coprinellus micaceus TaxID=71717 RepID=A0A4Y7SZL2_COPMI|nr:hypothetical protein FA13DRAFT_1756136 [Coprinellus micaceus]
MGPHPSHKIHQSKKVQLSKSKGAVRAKTGCYTCRIRRKKCDEERTDRDTCRTCDRLRLECLGFGAKRPEWLRENRNVVALREQIKVFLASQGLIKGHSGAGPRPNDGGPQILRLSAAWDPHGTGHHGYHTSDSDSPPTRSLSLSDDDDRHRLMTSSIRDQPADIEPAWFPPIMNTYSVSSYTQSKFSIQTVFDEIRFDVSPLDSRGVPYSLAIYSTPVDYIPQVLVDDSIHTYYLLGDRSNLPSMIWESCQNHGLSQKALSLLTSIYYRRQQHPNQAVLTGSDMHAQLRSLLDELTKGNLDDPDNAIAALHGVSMFLFDGGQGAWLSFLQLASKYVSKVLHSQAYGNPKDALLYANWKDAFIVKTSIWFDAPHFLDEVRAMFNPNFPSVYDPSFDSNPQCSMMSPMGCENRIVWALAETSTLASWKDKEKANHRLNIMELVQKANEIEAQLSTRRASSSRSGSWRQEIFRCSTRLFLATVVNDDYPQVRKIQDCVDEVIQCYRNLFQPNNGLDMFSVSRSVIRSTVFAIYLAGSLTTDVEYRQELVGYLDRESAGRNSEGVGNCASIRKMLEDVWRDMAASPAQPVPWRLFLKEREILLV